MLINTMIFLLKVGLRKNKKDNYKIIYKNKVHISFNYIFIDIMQRIEKGEIGNILVEQQECYEKKLDQVKQQFNEISLDFFQVIYVSRQQMNSLQKYNIMPNDEKLIASLQSEINRIHQKHYENAFFNFDIKNRDAIEQTQKNVSQVKLIVKNLGNIKNNQKGLQSQNDKNSQDEAGQNTKLNYASDQFGANENGSEFEKQQGKGFALKESKFGEQNLKASQDLKGKDNKQTSQLMKLKDKKLNLPNGVSIKLDKNGNPEKDENGLPIFLDQMGQITQLSSQQLQVYESSVKLMQQNMNMLEKIIPQGAKIIQKVVREIIKQNFLMKDGIKVQVYSNKNHLGMFYKQDNNEISLLEEEEAMVFTEDQDSQTKKTFLLYINGKEVELETDAKGNTYFIGEDGQKFKVPPKKLNEIIKAQQQTNFIQIDPQINQKAQAFIIDKKTNKRLPVLINKQGQQYIINEKGEPEILDAKELKNIQVIQNIQNIQNIKIQKSADGSSFVSSATGEKFVVIVNSKGEKVVKDEQGNFIPVDQFIKAEQKVLDTMKQSFSQNIAQIQKINQNNQQQINQKNHQSNQQQNNQFNYQQNQSQNSQQNYLTQIQQSLSSKQQHQTQSNQQVVFEENGQKFILGKKGEKITLNQDEQGNAFFINNDGQKQIIPKEIVQKQ